MEIIPAIDIKGGHCVRLLRGDYDKETVYSKNPGQMAKYWEQQGAKRLHMVDLDGARDGKPVNLDIINEITSSITIPVQLGGGIRSIATIEQYLSSGLDRVILGTIALEKPDIVKQAIAMYGPDKIVVGVDARKGRVAVKGWLKESSKKVEDLVAEMKNFGVRTFIYTDISKDGTLEGPDMEGLKKYNQIEDINLIASGGVSNIEDLKRVKDIGIKSIIVGKALYTEDLSHDFKQLENLL